MLAFDTLMYNAANYIEYHLCFHHLHRFSFKCCITVGDLNIDNLSAGLQMAKCQKNSEINKKEGEEIFATTHN